MTAERSREELLAELNGSSAERPRDQQSTNTGEWQPFAEVMRWSHEICMGWANWFASVRQNPPHGTRRAQIGAGDADSTMAHLGMLVSNDPPPFVTELLGPFPRRSDEREFYESHAGRIVSESDLWQHAAGAITALRLGAGIDIGKAKHFEDPLVEKHMAELRLLVTEARQVNEQSATSDFGL